MLSWSAYVQNKEINITWRVKVVTNIEKNKQPVSSKLKSRSIGTPMIQATRTLNGT
jgi:hypothetical protein